LKSLECGSENSVGDSPFQSPFFRRRGRRKQKKQRRKDCPHFQTKLTNEIRFQRKKKKNKNNTTTPTDKTEYDDDDDDDDNNKQTKSWTTIKVKKGKNEKHFKGKTNGRMATNIESVRVEHIDGDCR